MATNTKNENAPDFQYYFNIVASVIISINFIMFLNWLCSWINKSYYQQCIYNFNYQKISKGT